MPIFRYLVATALILPQIALAANIVAADSVAGLGTTINISELKPRTAVEVVVTPPFGSEAVHQKTASDEGLVSLELPGRDTEIAGLYQVSLEQNGRVLAAQAEFEVLTESLSLTESTMATHFNGTANETDITVTLLDKYQNPLPNRPVELISSNPQDTFRRLASETDEQGQITFVYTNHGHSPATVRALDLLSATALKDALNLGPAVGGPIPANQTSQTNQRNQAAGGRNLYRGSNFRAQLSYGLIDHFVITGPDKLELNEDATIRITAVDSNGNRVEDYVGLALLSSTDPEAYLPVNGEVQFEPRNLGEKVLTLGLRFRTPSSPNLPHILYVEDSKQPDVNGQAYIDVLGGRNNVVAKKIQITTPAINGVLNQTDITITGIADPFVNLKVSGDLESEVTGETNINGTFAIPVALDAGKDSHTLRVKDEFGLLDSGEFTVFLDANPPVIDNLTYLPQTPTEATEVWLMVESEPNLASLEIGLLGETYPIEPVPNQPGKYQVFFQAPAAGTYQPIISLTDAAGNLTELDSTLISQLRGLPIVTNLSALSENNSVTLQWDPITSEPVEAYRIYVGRSRNEFTFTLDTNSPTTAAQVAGLSPGQEYFFAVTGLQGERESNAKSSLVAAVVQGIELVITPQAGSLNIDWSSLNSSTPLSSFILEYGIEPNNFIEKRVLNGDLRNYVLRDLIDEVTYFLKLTPVSVTGQAIDDLAATAEGTPTTTVAGFNPTAGEAVPFSTTVTRVQSAAPPNLHSAAPQTVSTGLATNIWWLLMGSLSLALIWLWYRRRSLAAPASLVKPIDIAPRH